jgi:hypothetical protein
MSGHEQMTFGRFKIGPLRFQSVQCRERVRRTIETELRLRLAQRVGRFATHRQCEDMIVVPLGFVEPPDPQTFGCKCLAVGDGVAAGEPVGQLTVGLFGIELAGDALARLLGAGTSKPFRHQFDDDVSERSDQRDHQDDEGPGLQPSGPRCVIDQRDIEQQNNESNGHGAFQANVTGDPWWP